MSKKDNQFVALTYKACPICGVKDDDQSEILIHKRLGDLSEIDKQITGFGTPCNKCIEYMQMGVIIVVVDESKTEDKANPYRTGHFTVVREEVIPRMIQPAELAGTVLQQRVCFMDIKAATEMGLIEILEQAK